MLLSCSLYLTLPTDKQSTARNLCCSYYSVLSFQGLEIQNSGSRSPLISSTFCALLLLLSSFLPSTFSFQTLPCFPVVSSHLAMHSYLTKTSPRSSQCLPLSSLSCSFSNDQFTTRFSDFNPGKGIREHPRGGGACGVHCPITGGALGCITTWHLPNFLFHSLPDSPFYFCSSSG